MIIQAIKKGKINRADETVIGKNNIRFFQVQGLWSLCQLVSE